MKKRKQDPFDLIKPIGALFALLFLLFQFSPTFHAIVIAIGVVGFWLLTAGVVTLIGWLVFRAITQAREGKATSQIDDLDEPAGNYVDPYEAYVAGLEAPSASEVRPRAASVGSAAETSLLKQVHAIDWFQFEKLVSLAYRKNGYSVARRGGANPDGGIDLVLGRDGQRWAVQCKQWRTSCVGVKAMREFLGALTHEGIQKGIFVTLCGYTDDARQLAATHGIEIVDDAGLVQMLESTDSRFDPETLAILRDTQKFCPKCESEMILRTATKGPNAGAQFWGCSTYPRCQFTMPCT